MTSVYGRAAALLAFAGTVAWIGLAGEVSLLYAGTTSLPSAFLRTTVWLAVALLLYLVAVANAQTVLVRPARGGGWPEFWWLVGTPFLFVAVALLVAPLVYDVGLRQPILWAGALFYLFYGVVLFRWSRRVSRARPGEPAAAFGRLLAAAAVLVCLHALAFMVSLAAEQREAVAATAATLGLFAAITGSALAGLALVPLGLALWRGHSQP